MIDKQEQRQRAAKLSAENAAKGLVAPKLDWPVPKKIVAPPGMILSPPTNPMDIIGQHINIGDTVVYTYYDTGALLTGKVIGFSQTKKSVKIQGKRSKGATTQSEFYKPVGNVSVI